jgi:hypothetical protein
MEKRQKTINGRNYQLLVPSVRQAMPLCTRVATLLGPALGSLGGQADEGGWSRLGDALRAVDPLKTDACFMDAIKMTSFSFNSQLINDDLNFERHFNQFRGDVYPCCCWALWECVRDFFPQLPDFSQIVKAAQAGAGSLSPKAGPMTTG